MPLPRYMPEKRFNRSKATFEEPPPPKPKASINDLDDYCLAKVIGYSLLYTSLPRDTDELIYRENVKMERSLSMVSKRWYFLTQSQVSTYGVCRIDLDRIIKGRSLFNGPRVIQANNNKLTGTPKTTGVLMQRNYESRTTYGTPAIKRLRPNGLGPVDDLTSNQLSSILSYNIGLHRKIQPLLLKYKHLIIEGTIKCDEFYKLLIALDSAKVEKLHLNLKIERDGSLSKDFGVMPKQLNHIRSLTLIWTNNVEFMFGNLLTWSIYLRAGKLKSLQIILIEETNGGGGGAATGNGKIMTQVETSRENQEDKIKSIEKFACLFLSKIQEYGHAYLEKIVFNRTSSIQTTLNDVPSPTTTGINSSNTISTNINCRYSSLLKDIFARERNLNRVETNDNSLIEHLIKNSDRLCTSNHLRYLKFSSIINSELLLKILSSQKNLGSSYLSVMIDNINQLDEIKQAMLKFKQIRHPQAICQICLHLKDQKFSDSEDKIKNLIQLSKLTELIVYIDAMQRVTIDCCHLMWSVGRALQQQQQQTTTTSINPTPNNPSITTTSSNNPQCPIGVAASLTTSSSSSSINSNDFSGGMLMSTASSTTGRCIFKVQLQAPSKGGGLGGLGNHSEITVPFGRCQNYKINSYREDMVRHREILKALKKDCYHQFVKSIRENVTS